MANVSKPVLSAASAAGRRSSWSGDTANPVIVSISGVPLCSPVPGDLVVVAVTGAYCFTMANNYNGALRPAVVFCRDGNAELRVRRETLADLLDRDVLPA